VYIPKIFDTKDALRVSLLASSIFLIISVIYAVYLHAQMSNEVTKVRMDLVEISRWYEEKAGAAKTNTDVRKYREIAKQAKVYANNLTGPRINPYAYTYLNYWIVAAGFVELDLSWEELGLPNNTIYILNELEERGWFGNSSFMTFDLTVGDYVQRLASKPKLHANAWTFYVIAFAVVAFSIFVGKKEEDYEVDIVPEVIYGAIALIPFWIVFIASALIALSGIFPFLRPNQVVIDSYLIVIVITIVLSAFSGMIVGWIKSRGGS